MSDASQKAIVVGMGEVLWDLFPSYNRPGGAPANVAYNVNALGNSGKVLSAVGMDKLGRELLDLLNSFGLDTSYVQRLPEYETGKVTVTFEDGEPMYEIHEDAAWDQIAWEDKLEELAAKTNAACFSSLAQRSAISRETLYHFLESMPSDSFRVLDVNLRPPFYTKEILEQSLRLSNVVKVNRPELDLMSELFDQKDIVDYLMKHYELDYVCVTLGEEGSKIVTKEGEWAHPGYRVDMSTGDLVGVGDAFISCIIHHLLKGTDPAEMLEKSNRYASYLVTRTGAMNAIPTEILEEVR